ncbi:protein transport protein Sec31B isoform X3 [Mesocricetus auratus]|uniref:Protein transport protein Sec31B isoform X3 n=1 Tax=Mesocricetus auratus TaxID=10036 RepID=A0ABM2XG65_MESAU|nr:protein transport protein Sec31B isoform X3 [Mesocricetus auratus]
MKLKELEKPAVQAWSPASQYPVYLATGTSAQQLDASFSTNATLEIFEVDFRDSSLDLKHKGILSVSSRFHKLIWGSFGSGLLENPGVIAGGGDNGMLTLYSAAHILSSEKEPLIAQRQKHTGAVRALDFNPFQGNLLASGASDSEIFIWDLNNLSVPMIPGSKSQKPPEDIRALSWNRQVQHILSSAHPSGRAVVWDLRKNEPIIRVSDHSNRMNCSGLAWHPDIATQLVLCSEDDHLPVIQLWDLRFASSPLMVLESHSRGILSMSWSQADAELLLSSAKDNQIFCWNLASSEVVYKLPTQNSWCFDVQWCPQNPPVFSAVSFDGWISLYSVMGRSWEDQLMRQTDKISPSFSKGQPLPVMPVPEQVASALLMPPLKKPPKWMRRPAGVSFAFGGKLVTFGLPSIPVEQLPQPCPRPVYISQVVTESEFLTRSVMLQEALGSGSLLNYCQSKIQQASLPCEKMLWQFLKVTFEHDSRLQFLRLLGFSKDEIQKKVDTCLKSDLQLGGSPQLEAVDLKRDRPHAFCHQASKHTTEEASASSAFFDELLPQNMTPWEIPTTEDTDGLLSRALLLGELRPAVELCMKEERFADAIILAQAGGAELLKWTQEHYLAKRRTKISPLLACVVKKNWKDLVCACSLKNWREALALLLTYSGPEKFPELCDMLGTRMEQEGGRALASEARLCYVCSGNVEQLVDSWAKSLPKASCPMALQDLMEKVIVLRRSLELLQGSDKMSPGPATAYRLTQYAGLLAAQGSLATAMSFLPSDCIQPAVQQLRDRLFHAQGSAVLGQQAPTFSFPRVAIGTTLHPKEILSYSMGSQTLHQVPAPSARPRATAQPSLVTPFTAFHLSPSQGSQAQSTGDYRVPGPQETLPLHFGPGVRPASSQPQLLGGQNAQAANPVGFSGTWPLSGPPPLMASPDIMQPGSNPLPETPRLFPRPPMGPLGPSPLSSLPSASPVSFPVAYPPGGPGALCSSSLLSTGILTPRPGQSSFHAPSGGGVIASSLPIPPLLCESFLLSPLSARSMTDLQREVWQTLTKIIFPAFRVTSPRSLTMSLKSPMSCSLGSQDAWQVAPATQENLPRKKLPETIMPPALTTVPAMCLGPEPPPQALLPQPQVSSASWSPPGAPREGSLQVTRTQLPPERKVLPAEHQCLKDSFEALIQRCSLSATDLLSPHVLAGLHEVARCVDAGSFGQGLAVHAQVAGCSSFSEVSSFMPVLKAVLTIAHKLQA